MKKELKDYLHLYLGCKVQTNEGIGELKGVAMEDAGCGSSSPYLIYLEGDGDADCIEWIKPILRPLSDMTEEEAKECWHLTDTEKQDIEGWQVVDYFRRESNFYEPETFHFLLSKHFDLFGLIESGLSIDKTKQES